MKLGNKKTRRSAIMTATYYEKDYDLTVELEPEPDPLKITPPSTDEEDRATRALKPRLDHDKKIQKDKMKKF